MVQSLSVSLCVSLFIILPVAFSHSVSLSLSQTQKQTQTDIDTDTDPDPDTNTDTDTLLHTHTYTHMQKHVCLCCVRTKKNSSHFDLHQLLDMAGIHHDTHMNESYNTQKTLTHTHIPFSLILEYVISHTSMRHVERMNESFASYVANMYQSYKAYEWVM